VESGQTTNSLRGLSELINLFLLKNILVFQI
jgi:hypothetical protein